MSEDKEKDPFGAETFDGISRQRSRCRVLIHSHVIDNSLNGVIDCSNDVVECQTSKSLKQGGGASLTIVPRRNYLNYIFPNDYVNIWFDPGDGRGFIRTFFGFVDRISRDIVTSEDGATTTMFSVSCSDFTKAFDKTCIYFNPHIADRDDFVGTFAGTKHLAGAALRTKGITIYGTPADLILNLSTLMLGFGSQFILPPKYPADKAKIDASREVRKKWVKARLPKDLQTLIGQGTITDWVKKLTADAANVVQNWKETPEAGPDTSLFNTDEKLSAAAIGALLVKAGLQPNTMDLPDIHTGLAVEATVADGKNHLLDILDYSFIEWLAIDGSIVSAPIWTQQGSVWGLMNAYANPIVNELFCDLRPLSREYSDDEPLKEGDYAREGDEHYDESLVDYLGPVSVRHVPAIVMREHPFSTIESINASQVKIFKKSVGVIQIGNIFSARGPGKAGRSIVKMQPVLHDFIALADSSQVAYKHLDVVTVHVSDIISENIGRSDNDVTNLFELYSDGPVGKHMKFLTQDLQPIANPVSVARHGLRVQTYTTRFARFSKKYMQEGGVDNYGTRQKLARWALMMDHWYQHNIEYLNGSITTRFRPEIRVGYRLDVVERNESYYTESVNQRWVYPGLCTTTLTLSRGQRNDPFPVYIKPQLKTFKGDRQSTGRLAHFFKQRDPLATQRAIANYLSFPSEELADLVQLDNDPKLKNLIDDPNSNLKTWGADSAGYIAANGGAATTYQNLADYLEIYTTHYGVSLLELLKSPYGFSLSSLADGLGVGGTKKF